MMLKRLRIVFSLFFFIWGFLFFVLPAGFLSGLLNAFPYFQITPSIFQIIKKGSILVWGGGLLIIFLTPLFGRFYCSSLCPFGTFQDGLSFLSLRKISGSKHTYKRSGLWFRYMVPGIAVLSAVLGSLLLVNFLDPFANTGRFFVDIFRPLFLSLIRFFQFIIRKMGFYVLKPASIENLFTVNIIISAGFLGLLYVLVLRRGRLFCNSLCPVGAVLSLCAFSPVFRVRLNRSACTSCGICETVCKSECIDSVSKIIDTSRCVSCFNCLSVCPQSALKYGCADEGPEVVKNERRSFLLLSVYTAAGLMAQRTNLINTNRTLQNSISLQMRQFRIIPPGSLSLKEYTSSCISCHKCVSVCPTRVIRPVPLTEKGMFQPYLDYFHSYCEYECQKCTQVCPTGAINPLTIEDKKLVKMGNVKFLKEKCIVEKYGTECGACAEHCPTKAVSMVPYGNGLKIPYINTKICIGCGVCEFVCPALPEKAIYVKGVLEHSAAEPPPKKDSKKSRVRLLEKFPF